jgi:hypothetical protein
MVRCHAIDYSCERACLQPANPLYIWNLVTSLVPKLWHDEIGGFDEKMPSWEDWDYWVRLAKAGKCFYRIPEPLVAYRFYTGERREDGINIAKSLIQYLIKKHEGITPMPCGCKKNKPAPPPASLQAAQSIRSQENSMPDSDVVLVTYASPNRGSHRVIGPQTQTNYGYRSGGDRFYVHKDDIKAAPHLFIPIPIERPKSSDEMLAEAVQTAAVQATELKPPEPLTEDDPLGFLREKTAEPKPKPKRQRKKASA